MLSFIAFLCALPFWKGITSTALFVLALFATHDAIVAAIVFVCSYVFCYLTEAGLK